MSTDTKKYLAVTFAVSWILWGVVAFASKFEIELFSFSGVVGKIMYVLGGVSPALCEIFLKKKSCSKEEFKRFLKSIINPKHSILIYLYTIIGAMLIQFLPVWFKLTEIKQPIYMGFVLIIPMIIGGGIEEIGWRGLLQPELEKKYSHIISAILVGIIWAVWHLPLWFISGTNQENINFLWFCINTIMLSFFIGSVTYVSGSIFMAILAHATMNAFWEVTGVTNEIFPSLLLMFFVIIVTMIIDCFIKKRKEN